jgi:GNAT superfamily N-acetyltransferase
VIKVRPAGASDAVEAIEVVRSSIRELCVADHENDPYTLDHWLANKTWANFTTWIQNPDNVCVVAEMRDRIAGVGLLHRSGEIRLFYIAPGSQRLGIGGAICTALEECARSWKLPALHLCSTSAARAFYEAHGFGPSGPPTHRYGTLSCFPYRKSISG